MKRLLAIAVLLTTCIGAYGQGMLVISAGTNVLAAQTTIAVNGSTQLVAGASGTLFPTNVTFMEFAYFTNAVTGGGNGYRMFIDAGGFLNIGRGDHSADGLFTFGDGDFFANGTVTATDFSGAGNNITGIVSNNVVGLNPMLASLVPNNVTNHLSQDPTNGLVGSLGNVPNLRQWGGTGTNVLGTAAFVPATTFAPGLGLYTNIYGLNGSFYFAQPTLAQYRAAAATVVTGRKSMDVLIEGDSAVWYGAGGYGIGGAISNTAYINTMQSNLTAYLYQMIPNARLGFMGSHIFDAHSTYLDVHYFDTNLVVPSNWGTFNADGIGGSLMVSANGTTNAISFTSGRTISGCRVYVYCATGGANGNANIILDGSTTLATIPCSSLSDVMYVTNVTFTSGMHTVFVQPTNNASTGVYLIGMVPYETNSINLINAGWEAATTGNWLESGAKYGPLQMSTNIAASLVILALGLNDNIQNQMASYSNNLYMLVTNHQGMAQSSVVICVPSASTSGRDLTQLSANDYSVGALLGCPVVDFNRQLTNGFNHGEFFTNDLLHPSAIGYADEARALMTIFEPILPSMGGGGGGGGLGTVTSVGVTVPPGLTVSGSPITGSGTLAINWANAGAVPLTNNQSGVTVLSGIAYGVTNGPSIWYYAPDSAMIISLGTGGVEFNSQNNAGYLAKLDAGGIGGGIGRLITQGITLGSGGGGDLEYSLFTNGLRFGFVGGTNGYVWNAVDGATNLLFLDNVGNLIVARGGISVSNALAALSNLVTSGWVKVGGNQTNLGTLTVTGAITGPGSGLTAIPESGVTSLTTDLAARATLAGNQTFLGGNIFQGPVTFESVGPSMLVLTDPSSTNAFGVFYDSVGHANDGMFFGIAGNSPGFSADASGLINLQAPRLVGAVPVAAINGLSPVFAGGGSTGGWTNGGGTNQITLFDLQSTNGVLDIKYTLGLTNFVIELGTNTVTTAFRKWDTNFNLTMSGGLTVGGVTNTGGWKNASGAGAGKLWQSDASGNGSWQTVSSGSGTVTSVAGDGTIIASTPAITTSGSLAFLTQPANSVLAGPTSGAAAIPTFQTAPTISGANITAISAANVTTGTLPAAQLPVATTGAFGAVKPDGSTITIVAGVISSVGGTGTTTGGSVYTQTTPTTIANTVTETSLLGAGTGSQVLGANVMTVGKVYTFKVRGFYSTTMLPNFEFKIKANSTVLFDTGSVPSFTGANSLPFEFQGNITVLTAGSSGTVQVDFLETSISGGQPLIYGRTATNFLTINTTIAQTLDATFIWATADPANVIVSTEAFITDGTGIGGGSLKVAQGGTGLGSGTAGGIIYFPTTTSAASTAALPVHTVVLGGGATGPVATSTGTSGQVLTSNGSGADPTFQPASGGVTATFDTRQFGGSPAGTNIAVGATVTNIANYGELQLTNAASTNAHFFTYSNGVTLATLYGTTNANLHSITPANGGSISLTNGGAWFSGTIQVSNLTAAQVPLSISSAASQTGDLLDVSSNIVKEAWIDNTGKYFGNGNGLTNIPTSAISGLVTNGSTRTNIIDGKLYTNSTGGDILVMATIYYSATAAAASAAVENLEMSGNATNSVGTATTALSIAMSYTNVLSGVVTNNGTFVFTNRSTGGNSAGIVPGISGRWVPLNAVTGTASTGGGSSVNSAPIMFGSTSSTTWQASGGNEYVPFGPLGIGANNQNGAAIPMLYDGYATNFWFYDSSGCGSSTNVTLSINTNKVASSFTISFSGVGAGSTPYAVSNLTSSLTMKAGTLVWLQISNNATGTSTHAMGGGFEYVHQ